MVNGVKLAAGIISTAGAAIALITMLIPMPTYYPFYSYTINLQGAVFCGAIATFGILTLIDGARGPRGRRTNGLQKAIGIIMIASVFAGSFMYFPIYYMSSSTFFLLVFPTLIVSGMLILSDGSRSSQGDDSAIKEIAKAKILLERASQRVGVRVEPVVSSAISTSPQKKIVEPAMKSQISVNPENEAMSMIIEVSKKYVTFHLPDLATLLKLDTSVTLELVRRLFATGVIQGNYLPKSQTIYFH